MIEEKTVSGTVWKKLFNDFFRAARETIRTGQTRELRPEEYPGLEELAEGERNALAKLDGSIDEEMLLKIFLALWALEQQFVNCGSRTKEGYRSDEYWDLLVAATDYFTKEYPSAFSVASASAFLDEVERRDKKERKAAP